MSINLAPVGATSVQRRDIPESNHIPPRPSSDREPIDNETIPAAPPPEVHDAVAAAASAPTRLQEDGRAMSFRIDDATGKVIVEIHDLQGNVLFTVPPSKALDIASGGTLQ
jgi:flagellar protein FlaG